MRDTLAGSRIRKSHREGDARVRDPYRIRGQPRVLGAALDPLDHAVRTPGIEANAVTDDPPVPVETGEIVSGGNSAPSPSSSPPTRSRWPWPRSAPSRSAGSRS